MDMKCGTFKTQASGMSGCMSAAKVIIGFVPDVLELRAINDESGLRSYYWTKTLNDAANTSGCFGIIESNDAVNCADADYGGTERRSLILLQINGISALDETYTGVLIESPVEGVGKKIKRFATWESATAVYNSRDKGQIGDIMVPKMYGSNIRAIESNPQNMLVYECLSNSAADSQTGPTNEPKWPTKAGESVVDDSLIWMARTAEFVQGGGKGFVIGHSALTENAVSTTTWQFKAMKCDVARNLGTAPLVGELYLGNV